MVELMLAAVLLAEGPDSGPVCFVSGEIYSSQTETKAALAPTNCPIDIHQRGRVITMTSPKWVVQVLIPENIGKQEFLYQWGETDARIGNRTVEVSYKPAEGALSSSAAGAKRS
jgi:hypothetical protein